MAEHSETGLPGRRTRLVVDIVWDEQTARPYDHYYMDRELAPVATGWIEDGFGDRDDSPRATVSETVAEDERGMLRFALGLAQEKVWSEGGFSDDDQAALDSLRRLAGEAP